jgi:alkanesulfonate monooxygenase SsuD/methylene tetrahydromethanopterin reductase-like flavin-dependent oxidoreductase (luciferase family)
MPLRYAIHVPTFAEPDVLVELAVTAEGQGWDGFLLWDHILGSREMRFPIVDSWVALGAIAHATTRIRIGTAITPLPRRRPWKLAREVTTLDRLSRGRAILGVGLGTPVDAEYGTFGEPTDPRILAERLDEGLEIVDGLLSGEPVHHAGAHYRVDGAVFLPRPVQRPRVPIWVGCSWPHRRPLARAARWDGVIMLQMRDDELVPIGSDEVAEVSARIRRVRTVRSPYDIAVVLPGLPHDPAGLEEAGATWVLVTGWLDDLPQVLAAGPPI